VEESEDERFEDVSDPAPPIELPSPELTKLEEIQELLAGCMAMPIRREKLSLALETSDGYIKKLLAVFREAEATSNRIALHHLYHIFKSIFLLNKNAIFEILFVGKFKHKSQLYFLSLNPILFCLELEINHTLIFVLQRI